jgi:hypothetical protein
MSNLNAVLAAAKANPNLGYNGKCEAGKAFIRANAVSVEASDDLRKILRAAMEKEANSRANSMLSYPSEYWDMVRDFSYFASQHHGDVRMAHGLSRHQYNCGDICCKDHKGPVGSWAE